MQCPRCQTSNPPQAKFCLECASPLARSCRSCGTPLPPAAKFCLECAHPVAGPAPAPGEARFASPDSYTPRHLVEKILTSKSALQGERKQVTVLFADLKGSMELLADRDPEEARKILDPVLERMMDAVHRYEGTVNQVMGDGIMALFGAPLAHEDHAVRACYAALRMQEAVRRYAEDARRSHGVTVQIRVGLNSGDVVVRSVGSDLRMDYSAIGETTHLAARMEQLAPAGSVFLAPGTLALAEGYVEVRPMGPVPVKGRTQPVEVFELAGAGPARSRLQAAAGRGFTRFVGRSRELEHLALALERAQGGHGEVVALVGEAGVGKSRLFWELTRSHRMRDWLVLESGSVSYGRATPYVPLVDLLMGYFQIESRDAGRKIHEKVTGKLLTLDRALEPALPALLALLDVPVEDAVWEALGPPERRARILDGVRRLLLRESQVQPLAVVFEDLHWIDEETQALLDSLVDSLPTSRLLLLVNYRPEYRHGWGGKSCYSQLRLDPLPPESADELLRALLGSDPALEPLKRLLVERTGGNPFFLEESVRTLIETGALVGERGACRLERSLPGVQVPATVQALLAARIDRLPPDDKALLQTAAVIGKDVPYSLLLAVAGHAEEAIRAGLGRLQGAEFLYEASLFPDIEYTFKHALTHEVAYGGLLHERRRTLHAAIVQAMERIWAGRLGEQVERLAHHAERGEQWEKAVTYLREAGMKAAARSANAQAVAYFEQALAALARLPDADSRPAEAVDLRIALGPVLIQSRGASVPEVEANYLEAQALGERMEDRSRLFPIVWGLWYFNYTRGRYDRARELGDRLLALAQDAGDPGLALEAHHALWATLVGLGEPVTAVPHLEQGRALYDLREHRSFIFRYGGHDPGVCARQFLAMNLWERGLVDQAREMAGEGLALARDVDHPTTSMIAVYSAAWVHCQRGESRAAAELAEAAIELGRDHGVAVWVEREAMVLGRSLIAEGRTQEGMAVIERHCGQPGIAGLSVGAIFSALVLAEAYALVARTDEALALVNAILEKSAAGEAEARRLRGEILRDRPDGGPDMAETDFRRALEAAGARGQRSYALRAATSLARLLARQGRRAEARSVLDGVYASFTEGFGTADLRAARALLDELSI
jgi:class 3 adenylate cyclase/tetratricopeptide (TPR) repeat protein